MKNGIPGNRLVIPYKTVFFLLLLLVLLLLIPLLVLAGFDIPMADDFSNSCQTHMVVQNGGGFFHLIAAAVAHTAEVYECWQGTFSAVFMMALQPSIWGFRFYCLTAWIMIIPLVGSIFLICLWVFSGIFGIEKSLSGIIASVITIACTQFLPSPNQSFYWYTGSVYYTLTFAIMLWFFSCLIAYLIKGDNWRIILLSALAIVIGGNNYVTALLSWILLTCIILGLFFSRRKRSVKVLLIPYLFLLLAFAVSMAAPGNVARQNAFTDHPGPINAIIISFRYAAGHIQHWTDLRFLACLLFLAPFLWKAAASSKECRFPFPGVVSLFSICLLASMFTPHVYAIGFDGPGRLQNVYYFAYVLLFVFNLYWWCGWIRSKKKEEKENVLSGIGVLPFLSFAGAALLCIICSVVFFKGSLSSVVAVGELRSGEAQAFYAQALERQAILEDPAVKDCVFSPFRENPYLLYFGDMTEDPHSYENEDAATFYGKNSIVVREE